MLAGSKHENDVTDQWLCRAAGADGTPRVHNGTLNRNEPTLGRSPDAWRQLSHGSVSDPL